MTRSAVSHKPDQRIFRERTHKETTSVLLNSQGPISNYSSLQNTSWNGKVEHRPGVVRIPWDWRNKEHLQIDSTDSDTLSPDSSSSPAPMVMPPVTEQNSLELLEVPTTRDELIPPAVPPSTLESTKPIKVRRSVKVSSPAVLMKEEDSQLSSQLSSAEILILALKKGISRLKPQAGNKQSANKQSAVISGENWRLELVTKPQKEGPPVLGFFIRIPEIKGCPLERYNIRMYEVIDTGVERILMNQQERQIKKVPINLPDSTLYCVVLTNLPLKHDLSLELVEPLALRTA